MHFTAGATSATRFAKNSLSKKYKNKHEKADDVEFIHNTLANDARVVIHIFDTTDGQSEIIELKEEFLFDDEDIFYKEKINEYIKKWYLDEEYVEKYIRTST